MRDDQREPMTRREWIRLLGAGAGLGFLRPWDEDELLAAVGQAGRAQKVAFPRGAIVRTILKDVPPDTLGTGVTLFHEHLSINLSGLAGRGGQPTAQQGAAPAAPGQPAAPPAQGQAASADGRGRQGGPPLSPVTDNVEMITELVNKAGGEGVNCIVDGGHTDMGRKMGDLRTIAGRTKVHIVASGGFYMQRTYPPDVATKTEDQIADDLVREARTERHGAFGEIGENPNAAELTLDERKVFRAIGKASVRTGLPIFTHNSYGTGPNVPRDIGLQQLDILESVGVRPEHIAIGHSCCLDDPQVTIISEIAKRGAFVGFDRVTTVQQIMPDDKKVAMVVAFLDAGHADKLLLSADFIGQRTLDAGPGYGRTLTVFAPLLRKAGVDEAMLRMILYDNPRRFLAFVPGKR
jgi:phosphotriesterase-related protein